MARRLPDVCRRDASAPSDDDATDATDDDDDDDVDGDVFVFHNPLAAAAGVPDLVDNEPVSR